MTRPVWLRWPIPGIALATLVLVVGYLLIRQPTELSQQEGADSDQNEWVRPGLQAESERLAVPDAVELEAIRVQRQLNQRQEALAFPEQALEAEQSILGGQSQQMHQDARQATWLANGLSLATAHKMVVAESFMMEGTFPQDNEEVGYPAAVEFAADGVKSIGIIENGIILIVYDQKTGRDNGTILLTPTWKAAIGRLEWRCTTSDYPLIENSMRSCHYEG